jgi:hypothetical protein
MPRSRHVENGAQMAISRVLVWLNGKRAANKYKKVEQIRRKMPLKNHMAAPYIPREASSEFALK